MTAFNQKQFYNFCSQLKIETKEQGLKKMGTLLGSQTYVMDEITKGLQDDVHFFVILKGRQLGITTVSLALDLYWHFIHPGLQGTLTTDTECAGSASLSLPASSLISFSTCVTTRLGSSKVL